MSLIPKFEDYQVGGRRKLTQAYLCRDSREDLRMIQNYGSDDLLSVADAIRLALRFAAEEIIRRGLAGSPLPRARGADPMGWKIGYKGAERLTAWLKERLPIAEGDELDMLREIEPCGYIQRMGRLRAFWDRRDT